MPGSFGSLAVVLLAASSFEAAVGADGEVSAGRAPVEVDGAEEDSIAFTLVPGAGLRLHTGQTTLSATYTPRVFYRLPNALKVSRPLVLHQVSLGHDLAVGKRLGWSSRAELSVGQLDYTAASVIFAQGAGVVRTKVAEVLRADGQSGVEVSLSRRTTWSLDLSGEYTTSLDDPIAEVPGDVEQARLGDSLPSSAGFSVDTGFKHALSRQDDLGVATRVAYQWFADTGEFLLVSPELSYSRVLGPDSTFALSGGLAYVAALGLDGSLTESDSLGGTGSVQLASRLYAGAGVSASGGITGSVEWFFDPIAGTSQPRVGIELGSDVSIGKNWQVAPTAAFFAVLRRSAVGGGQTLTPEEVQAIEQTPDATLLRGELPFRYRISEGSSFNFGVRAAMRGRAIGVEGFALDEQIELWGFLGLTVRASTARGEVGWLGL